MKDKKQQINEYCEWLQNDFNWSFWCTVTTKNKLTYKSAHRLVDRFVNNLRLVLIHNQMNMDCEPRVFYVVEPFEQKEGVHLHILLQCSKKLRFAKLRTLWGQAVGGSLGKSTCHIKAYTQEAHICHYLAEKVISQRVEWDFMRIALS